ncbi:MAG: putative threonine-phosphate decarboxylase [Ilumatobacteraceae bacterium]|nr:putative threonine-phosphate decarboxylase [Ilumatobacteraceae bacterium]
MTTRTPGAQTGIPPSGSHGGDGARVAAAIGIDPASMIDLSASMNPFAPDVAALLADLLRRAGSAVHRYPDPTGATIALADAIGADADQLVLTNGGAEAIALTAAHLRVGNVIEPEFSLYRRHLTAVDPAAARWRSNPSNPLGQLAAPEDTAGVWDEAFYPIATGRWTRGDAGAWQLGSLTKLWNCPGLRLGYVIAPTADEAHAIRHRQPRWSVNGLALAALPELLAVTDLPSWSAQINTLRHGFATALRGVGFHVTDTDSNWLLVHHANLRVTLAGHGVLVRDCSTFGLAGVHRVALPPPHHFDRVLEAFASVHAR